MHNSSPTIDPINDLTYEEPSQEDNIQALIYFLKEHKSYQNPKEYTILECFPTKHIENYKPKVYKVINLIIEQENGIVFSSSSCETFPDLSLSLSGFCVTDVVYIGFQNYDNIITITLNSGFIKIQY